MSKSHLGITAVILGIIALGLAIIPRALFGVPPPWPSKPAAQPQQVVEGGKTFEWKGAKITIGGTAKVIDPPPPPSVPISSKAVFIVTAVVALASIAAGLIASWRERSYLLGGAAVAVASVALLWHYILVGVAVGVAIVVVFLLLASVADACPA